MTEQDTANANADALAEELRRIIEQAEALMRAAGADGPTLGALKDRVNDTIDAAREKLAELQVEARQRGRSAVAATESWVQANPWAALAIGAGVGLIVGALIMRSSPAPGPGFEDPEA
jgi:ElaB/YqjD/DUF883 family membrane-anchored ribosome-binding protein